MGGGGRTTKEVAIRQVLNELKKELREEYSVRFEREDGLPSKDFFVKIHTLIYKYKKYGHDMI